MEQEQQTEKVEQPQLSQNLKEYIDELIGENIDYGFIGNKASTSSQPEIDNIYAKVMDNPEQTGAYKTGHILGEIIPFLIMPSVSVAEFPMITNLLLTALYQSFIDSATHSVIDNGISKKLIPDVVKGVALALLNTLLAHGLLKNVDKSKLLKELENRLQKLIDELAKSFSKPIRQADGSIILKKAGKHHNSYTITEEIQNKINKAKNKPIKAVKIPSEDMGAIHHNIETYGFTDAEITDGYAARFSAYYGVIVKIYNGSFDDLHYVIIMKWRLK